MKDKCAQPDCGVPEGLSCEIGHTELAECPNFRKANADEPIPGSIDVNVQDLGQRLPWSGRALGLSDLMLASARSSPTLVGLIGPYSAGKTAFLTSIFVHFAASGAVGPFEFAGSYSLEAWSQLKHYTEWPSNNGPSFPPHTPDSADRVPSLLHLALRVQAQAIQDILFTDAPGEWFTRWIQNQLAENSRGARWIADHASHFLFFVDRAALAGEHVGRARQDTLALARLLSEQRRDRPIVVIWAKSDLKCAPDVEAVIREKLLKFFGAHQSFEVHAEDPLCLDVLRLLLKPRSAPRRVSRAEGATVSAFLAYRGRSE